MSVCAAFAFAFACGLANVADAAEWQPAGLVPTNTSLADVLAASAKATGTPPAAFANRRERWTYLNGGRSFPVDVAVRGDDYHVAVALGAATYEAGRLHGVRWRGDANGIVHGLFADQQGDAVDRVPQCLFALDRGALTVAGQTAGPAPAWVIADRPAGEPPAWFFVDQADGTIVREQSREGRRVHTTRFDSFAAVAGVRRPRHWHITDGTPAHDLDVRVDDVVPQAVPEAAVALPPTERVFAPSDGNPGAVELPASFNGGRVVLDTVVDGLHQRFILDSGTASITLSSDAARRFNPILEHASVPHMSVGGVALDDVSVLTTPFDGDGILGYDFFFGHVVRIDYLRRRVEIYDHETAEKTFRDPQTTIVHANVDNGLPLVHIEIGPARSDTFAVDTGSARILALLPFAARNESEIAAHWTSRGPSVVERFLEGSIEVAPREVASFRFGSFRFDHAAVGLQVPSSATDQLATPFDGIIGTNVLSDFDVWFDYDNNRIGLRR